MPRPILSRLTNGRDIRPAQKKFLSLFPATPSRPLSRRRAAAIRPARGREARHVCRAGALSARSRRRARSTFRATSRWRFWKRSTPRSSTGCWRRPTSKPFKDAQGTGNDNPERKWCTGRAALICIQSSYRLEGRIPLGIMLVNKLRDTPKKVSDQIDFQSELSQVAAADLDQAGLRAADRASTRRWPACSSRIFLRQPDHEVRKFFAVFQADPADADEDRRHRLHGAVGRFDRARPRKRNMKTSRCCAISCPRRC